MWYDGGHVVGIGTFSSYGGGTSGGPWLSYYQPYYTWSNRNIVESVNSFSKLNSAGNRVNGSYGPYFDSANIKELCDWVPGGC